jgi:hypothetical protein
VQRRQDVITLIHSALARGAGDRRSRGPSPSRDELAPSREAGTALTPKLTGAIYQKSTHKVQYESQFVVLFDFRSRLADDG